MHSARLLDLGMRPVSRGVGVAARLHAAVRDGREPDTWIVVEHTPVITLGRQAKRENVLLSAERLAARGVDRRRDRARRRRDVSRPGAARRLSDSQARALSGGRASGRARSRRGDKSLRAIRRRGERWSEHAGRMGRPQPDLRHRPRGPADGLAARHRAQRFHRPRLRPADQSVRFDAIAA